MVSARAVEASGSLEARIGVEHGFRRPELDRPPLEFRENPATKTCSACERIDPHVFDLESHCAFCAGFDHPDAPTADAPAPDASTVVLDHEKYAMRWHELFVMGENDRVPVLTREAQFPA